MPTSTCLCFIVAVVISAALVAAGAHPEFWSVQKAVTLAFAPLRSMISDPPRPLASRPPSLGWPVTCAGDIRSCSGLLAPYGVGGAIGEDVKQRTVDHAMRGDAYAMQNQFEKAIVEYDDAISTNRYVAESYFRRGLMFFAKNENTQAIVDFSSAIRLDARNALAYRDRGQAYVAVGYYDNAIADFDNAIRLDPSLAAAFFGRGRAYQAKGDVARAQADFAEASRLGEVFSAPTPTAGGQVMEPGGK